MKTFRGDFLEEERARQKRIRDERERTRGIGSLEGTLFGGGAPSATHTPTMQDVERDLAILALNRGNYGITADDVIKIMREKGIAYQVGREKQRRFSNTGTHLKDMARRGLLAAKTYKYEGQLKFDTRPSTRPEAHGNPQIIYLHPSHARKS